MTNDIDKEISVGAAVTINDPKLPSNENLTRQGEDKDNDNPTYVSELDVVLCITDHARDVLPVKVVKNFLIYICVFLFTDMRQ